MKRGSVDEMADTNSGIVVGVDDGAGTSSTVSVEALIFCFAVHYPSAQACAHHA